MRRRNKLINQNDETLSVKAGELHPGRGAAFIEYTTRQGEELPDHTHPTEDEIFYVLQGELTFRCGDESFEWVRAALSICRRQLSMATPFAMRGMVASL
jgi:quercetin dioxygenase-like cupin family protein